MSRIAKSLTGIVIGLFICALIFYSFEISFYRGFVKKALAVKKEAGAIDKAVFLKDRKLPEPVMRYLKWSGVLDSGPVSFSHLKHAGRFRPGIDKPWMPIFGEYYITANKPSFIWYGKIPLLLAFSAVAVDEYFNGKARMNVKMLSMVDAVNVSDKNTALSGLGRLGAELMMCPGGIAGPGFAWKKAKKDSAPFVFSDSGLSCEGELFVNPDGSPERIEVIRYYDRGNGNATPERFVGKCSGIIKSGPYVMPERFQGSWELKEGKKFDYVDFIINKAELE